VADHQADPSPREPFTLYCRRCGGTQPLPWWDRTRTNVDIRPAKGWEIDPATGSLCPCCAKDKHPLLTTRTSPQLSEGMVERAEAVLKNRIGWLSGWSAERLNDVVAEALTAALAALGDE
jgi:hypothetical protein